MELTDAIPVRTLFARTIETLVGLVEQRPPRERAAIRKAIATLRAHRNTPSRAGRHAACKLARTVGCTAAISCWHHRA